MMAQIQFPWRYLGFATLFAVLLLGELLRRLYKEPACSKRRFSQICLLLSAAVFLETSFFSSNYFSGAERHAYYNVDQVVIGNRDTAEYLREDTKISELTYEMEAENVTASVIARDGTRMQIQCQTADEGGQLTLPILNYKGYVARSGKGEDIEIKDGINNEITLIIPPGFHDTVKVEFRPPRYWRAAWWSSVLFAIGLAVISIMKYKRWKTAQVKRKDQ